MTGLTCDSNDLEQKVHKTWEDIHHQVNYWCEHLQSVSGWCPWSDVLHKCARQCQFLTNYMGIGDVTTKEARKQKEKLCGMINDTDTKVSLDTLSNVKEVFDVVWIKNSASMALGLYSGLLSFHRLLPAALSVAPGLLKAALRIKVVVPQSYLPGVFIVLMPLMYMPMVWACGVCAVQGIGEIWLLVSLACLAFSPAVYTVLGIVRAVTSPISQKGVLFLFANCQKLDLDVLLGGPVLLRTVHCQDLHADPRDRGEERSCCLCSGAGTQAFAAFAPWGGHELGVAVVLKSCVVNAVHVHD